MNTETLITVSVPLFLLAGMAKKGDQFVATVVSHEGKELTLDVSGTVAKIQVANQKRFFRKNLGLVFNAEGALVDTNDSDDIYQPAPVQAVAAAPAPRSTGSNEYRTNKLF